MGIEPSPTGDIQLANQLTEQLRFPSFWLFNYQLQKNWGAFIMLSRQNKMKGILFVSADRTTFSAIKKLGNMTDTTPNLQQVKQL